MYEKEKTLFRRIIENMDWTLFITVTVLIMIGMISVYSATLSSGVAGKFIGRQMFAILLGVCGMLILVVFNYQYFKHMTTFLYSVSIVLLVLVLIFGTVVRGTKGWFDLSYFSFQPVEITKLMFVLFLAGYLDKKWREMKRLTALIVPVMLLLVQAGLILMQPDFSSTLVYFPVTLVLFYVVGVEPLYLFGIMLFGSLAVGIPLMSTYLRLHPLILKSSYVLNYLVIASRGGYQMIVVLVIAIFLLFVIWWFLTHLRISIPAVYFITLCMIIVMGSFSSIVVQKSLKEYQRKRLIVFLDPNIDPLGAGYNIKQSKIAIGSGRFLGRGLFSGTQAQLGYVPEQHTDFIFSVLAEEAGYFVSQLTIFVYFFLIWRAMLVARDARDRFGSLVATGIATMYAFYGIINIGMVMGMMPTTGLPLPFLSYGGSCMVSSLWGIGILLSIHIRRFTH